MSWPIGRLDIHHSIGTANDGAIVIGSARVTEAHGWLRVTIVDASDRARSWTVDVRVRVAHDGPGETFVYLEDLVHNRRRYAGVLSAIAMGHGAWADGISDAVRVELLTRHRRATRAPSAVHAAARYFDSSVPPANDDR
jgi:hypothetical protein